MDKPSWTDRLAQSFVGKPSWTNQRHGQTVLQQTALHTFWADYLELVPKRADDAAVAEWLAVAVHDTLEMATDFFVRIVNPLRVYPHTLFWIAYRPPFDDCPERRKLAP